MLYHTARMPSFLLLVVCFSLAVVAGVQAALTVNCGKGSVTVQWTEANLQVDPHLLHLGHCPPSQISVEPEGFKAVFHAQFGDCGIRRLVRTNAIVFLTEITSDASEIIYYPVTCTYERPDDWEPPLFKPHFHTHANGNLAFHLAVMKDDFSGESTSRTFSLGSNIPIAAWVDQSGHQPLILLLDECVAYTTPDLRSDSQRYPLITNKGCLVDSKTTNSKFLPRAQLSEIRLNLQTFKFAVGEDVYLHCRLVAWDPQDLGSDRKACQYDDASSRWILVDDPSQSALCNCCDSSCEDRRKRRFTAGFSTSLLGPLAITS